MGIYSIYKSTNIINGMCYIGFASNFTRRKSQHKKSSFDSERVDYHSNFHKSIREYGWDNFLWEIIYQSKNKIHTLKHMEPYFIKEYGTLLNGYNMTLGGEGCFGYKHTEEHKEKMRTLFIGKNNPMYGKSYIRTKEHIQNMSELKKGITKTKEHIQKRVDSVSYTWKIIFPNNDIQIIKNLAEFCRNNNLNKTSMRKVSLGLQKQHKNFKCSLVHKPF
jgi:group I intron endonuclease